MHTGRQATARVWLTSRSARPLIVLGLTAIYSLCFAAIKAGLPFAPPLRFAALRGLIGGVALLMVMAARRQRLLPSHQSWPWIIAVGITATTIAFGAMFLSPGRTGAGIASVLGNIQPVLVPALAAIYLDERMTRGKWAALAFGVIGVTLIASPVLTGVSTDGVVGPALALAASVGLAVSTIIVKRMGPRIDILMLTAWQLIVGGLPLLAASAILERDVAIVWSASFVGLLLFLALVGTAVANVIWYWLLQPADVGRLTMFFFLVPVFGLAIAALAFDEKVGLREGSGVVVVLAGMGVMAWEAWRKPEGLSSRNKRR
jgi:drug/metabolite transporter (DMT)-like permease